MTDLTKITTPFGLLDRETQEALKAHGGPYEIFTNLNGWQDFVPHSLSGKLNSIDDRWHRSSTIRVKHAPPKPREWWAVGKHLHDTENDAISFRKACADDHGSHHLRTPIIHVREVLE